KTRLPKLSRRTVFVIAHPLEPNARADLLDPVVHLNAVRPREQVAPIPRPRRIVWTCSGDGSDARRRRPAPDAVSARPRTGNKGSARGERAQQNGVEIESRTRIAEIEHIQDTRTKHVRFAD